MAEKVLVMTQQCTTER